MNFFMYVRLYQYISINIKASTDKILFTPLLYVFQSLDEQVLLTNLSHLLSNFRSFRKQWFSNYVSRNSRVPYDSFTLLSSSQKLPRVRGQGKKMEPPSKELQPDLKRGLILCLCLNKMFMVIIFLSTILKNLKQNLTQFLTSYHIQKQIT